MCLPFTWFVITVDRLFEISKRKTRSVAWGSKPALPTEIQTTVKKITSHPHAHTVWLTNVLWEEAQCNNTTSINKNLVYYHPNVSARKEHQEHKQVTYCVDVICRSLQGSGADCWLAKYSTAWCLSRQKAVWKHLLTEWYIQTFDHIADMQVFGINLRK